MTRYAKLFRSVATRGGGALIPFAVLGDPDEEQSEAWIDRLVEAGADALELGLPFSDPIADGPVVQAAAQRALAAGGSVTSRLALIGRIRSRHPTLPIGLLVYANLVVRRGVARFYANVAAAGVDSVLVADVPLAESGPFAAAAEASGVAPVMILPPNASDERTKEILGRGRGYTYVTARSGVTGESGLTDPALARRLEVMRALGGPPPVVGFGISGPADVRLAIAAGAAGVIVGSALLSRAAESQESALRFLASLKEATTSPPRHPVLVNQGQASLPDQALTQRRVGDARTSR